ncbi:MAG: sulfotransferase [Verrucomicrobiales bacterium]|nr:sulfotransferase [Verrucomicrobiales bacterium]
MPRTKNRPDFLVIGAMKCGTTSLYHDLLSHPDIFLPDKESNLLLSTDPASAYASAYQKSTAHQICGEVCPDYSKLPDFPNPVPAAKALFPDTAPRILYLVREPLARTLSHHRFVSSRRDTRFATMPADINRCLHDHPELIHYSRYAMQLRPWIEAFGKNSIQVIRFEDYIENRQSTLHQITRFLDLPDLPTTPTKIHNATQSRPILTPTWQRFITHNFYRRILRPLIPSNLREKLRQLVLPKADPSYIPPTAATQQKLIDQLRDDAAELQQLLERDSPLWQLD